MAITKFTDVADTGYDVAINKDTTNQTERDKFLAGLVTKIDELTDLLNNHITDMATNNAKNSMVIGTSGTTALAGDTNIVTIGSSTTIAFGNMITVPPKGKIPASYNIVMTVVNGGVTKTVKLTLA